MKSLVLTTACGIAAIALMLGYMVAAQYAADVGGVRDLVMQWWAR